MGDELNTLIQMTNKAIAQYAGAEARIQSLQESIGDLKRQMAQALEGIGETQKNMVLALEKLNANIEEHKTLHRRIDAVERSAEEHHSRLDCIEHSCAKEAHEEVLAHVENINRILSQNGIWQVREGNMGLADTIAHHERFVNRMEGKIGWALLGAVLIGLITDFAFHYDFVKKIFSVFTG